jgi:uncharacterized protein with GYD domain
MTMGKYDLVIVDEAPSDEAMAEIMPKIGTIGSLGTPTLRAFDEVAKDESTAWRYSARVTSWRRGHYFRTLPAD